MTFTASDVLLKAASRIEEEGMWCQGQFYLIPVEIIGLREQESTAGFLHRLGVRVPECVLGAIASATYELDRANTRLYVDAADRFQHYIGQSLSSFNDAAGRTAAEVAEAMRRAAL